MVVTSAAWRERAFALFALNPIVFSICRQSDFNKAGNMSLTHDASGTSVTAPSSAQLLRLLADNIPALVAYFVKEDFRCLFANKAYAKSFGLDEF